MLSCSRWFNAMTTRCKMPPVSPSRLVSADSIALIIYFSRAGSVPASAAHRPSLLLSHLSTKVKFQKNLLSKAFYDIRLGVWKASIRKITVLQQLFAVYLPSYYLNSQLLHYFTMSILSDEKERDVLLVRIYFHFVETRWSPLHFYIHNKGKNYLINLCRQNKLHFFLYNMP